MKFLKLALGRQIKKYRKQQGISQAELASLLDIDPVNVSRWETGRNFPDEEKLPTILKTLNCSENELMDFFQDGSQSITNQRLVELNEEFELELKVLRRKVAKLEKDNKAMEAEVMVSAELNKNDLGITNKLLAIFRSGKSPLINGLIGVINDAVKAIDIDRDEAKKVSNVLLAFMKLVTETTEQENPELKKKRTKLSLK